MLRVAPRTTASFGALLRKFRIAAGLSRAALGEQADIGPDTLNALEGDESLPSAHALAALATALELSDERRRALESAATAAGAGPPPAADEPRTARSTNLAAALRSFVGRDAELGEIATALQASRLVTIIGAGGVGKTRTAQQVALDSLDAFPDGGWFVELAPLADPQLVPAAIAAVLRLNDAGGAKPLLQTVVTALRKKRALLVLDNCEHVRGATAAAAEALLAGCPKLRILATGREGLGLDQELLYRLPPLAVGEGAQPRSAGDALRYGAVALFVARAQAASADFVLTDALAPAVVEICRSLDGIALAIELAAARLADLTVEQLAERLDDRFRVLTGGGAALPRQQTLRALIDWSFDLLTPAERTIFVRLAIFRGNFTAAAAAEVCGEPGIDVESALVSLADKSLLAARLDCGRFRLPATTAQYAAEKLLRSGEHDAVARRLATWARRFAERAGDAWEATPEQEWRDSVERELDNVRAALEWTLGRGREPLTGAAIAVGLSHFWRREKREGRRWFEAALAELGDEAPPELCAQLALGLSWTLPVGRQSLDAAQRAVREYRELGDQRCLAMALLNLGGVMRAEPGWVERSEAAFTEALALAQATGFRRLIPSLLGAVADRKRDRGLLDEARALLEQALAIAREERNLLGLATALSRLAEVEFDAGEFAAARRYGAEATETDGKRNAETAVSADRCDLAAYAIAEGDLAGACEQARAVIAMADRVDQPVHVAIAVDHLAVVAALSGDAERAARLMGFSDGVFRRLAYTRQPVERRGELQARAILTERFDEDELIALSAQGEALGRDDAVAEALRVGATAEQHPA